MRFLSLLTMGALALSRQAIAQKPATAIKSKPTITAMPQVCTGEVCVEAEVTAFKPDIEFLAPRAINPFKELSNRTLNELDDIKDTFAADLKAIAGSQGKPTRIKREAIIKARNQQFANLHNSLDNSAQFNSTLVSTIDETDLQLVSNSVKEVLFNSKDALKSEVSEDAKKAAKKIKKRLTFAVRELELITSRKDSKIKLGKLIEVLKDIHILMNDVRPLLGDEKPLWRGLVRVEKQLSVTLKSALEGIADLPDYKPEKVHEQKIDYRADTSEDLFGIVRQSLNQVIGISDPKKESPYPEKFKLVTALTELFPNEDESVEILRLVDKLYRELDKPLGEANPYSQLKFALRLLNEVNSFKVEVDRQDDLPELVARLSRHGSARQRGNLREKFDALIEASNTHGIPAVTREDDAAFAKLKADEGRRKAVDNLLISVKDVIGNMNQDNSESTYRALRGLIDILEETNKLTAKPEEKSDRYTGLFKDVSEQVTTVVAKAVNAICDQLEVADCR